MRARSAVYLRTNCGQEHQTGSNSIDNQKEHLMDWASREGMEIVEVYSDVSKSGRSISGLNELRRLLNDVITHKLDIDYVLVSEPSRLGRK